MVLGGDPGQIDLGRAKSGHVRAGLGSVQVHEQAASLPRSFAAHRLDIGQHTLAVVDVGAARKRSGDAVRAVGKDHLFGTDHQRDVAGTCSYPVQCLKQGGRAGGAGVLDIDDGDAGDAQAAQGDLAAHRVLTLQHGLARVREPGRLDVAGAGTCVLQSRRHSLGGQGFDAVVRALAQRRHGNAGNERRSAHAVAGRRRCTMRNREATKAASARHALPAGFRPVT